MAVRFSELIVDSSEPARLAEFWAAVLAVQPSTNEWGDPTVASSDGSGPILVFVPVPERKTIKNRLHIDLSPVGGDQAQEVERILALGARRADVGQGEQTWVVLADPEGNEFCVLERRLD